MQTRSVVSPGDTTAAFPQRWSALLRLLLVESSVKLIARTAMDHADQADGSGCRVSNDQLARETSYSERTVRTAWGVLRGLGLAERVASAGYDAVNERHVSDEYRLTIPDGWHRLPLLGASSAKFWCLWCHRRFNPQANCGLLPDGRVTFEVHRFCFCAGRVPGAKLSCFDSWQQAESQNNSRPWDDVDRWSMFRRSRCGVWNEAGEWSPEPVPESPKKPPSLSQRAIPTPPPPRTPGRSQKRSATALYRYWDEDGKLLYVGITGDLSQREEGHIRRSSWMELAAKSSVARFSSREEAEDAELEAIRLERPLFNAKHNDSREARQRLVDYLIERGRTDLLAPAISRG